MGNDPDAHIDAAPSEGSDFTDPKAVGQPGAAFGELECAFFSVGMGECLRFFLSRPARMAL